MTCVTIKPVLQVSDQVRHKLAVQPLKMASGSKFRTYETEELYYLCSENKGVVQLCMVTAQLISSLVFAYAKSRFSHDAVHIFLTVRDLDLDLLLLCFFVFFFFA